MKRVALYARVSTDDKDQNPDTQLFHLRKYAAAFNFKIVDEFVEEGKSGTTLKGRSEYLKMMNNVDKGRYDAIVAYKLDRFHRNTLNAILFIDHLRNRDVDLIITSQNIDTSNAMGRAMFQITAIFAELESANTSERTKLGMERAKAEGKICHRPPKTISKYQLEKAKEIIAENPEISHRKLAEHFNGIGRTTLVKLLREEGIEI